MRLSDLFLVVLTVMVYSIVDHQFFITEHAVIIFREVLSWALTELATL